MEAIVRTIIMVAALLPGIAAAAEQPKKKSTPTPAPVTSNACAQYGAGWVQVAGTNTCVKASGSMQVDIGVTRR